MILPRLTPAATLAALLVVAGAACTERDTTSANIVVTDEAETDPGASTITRVTPQLPATSGSAVWAYLQSERYRETWSMWPGLGELYEGQEPHGLRLTTYLNDRALKALSDGAGKMPNDAIIVKENYHPDGSLVATTVMYKVDGYNSAHNDWFFSKHQPDGSIAKAPDGTLLSGRVASCQDCHSQQEANDYLYTGKLSESPAK